MNGGLLAAPPLANSTIARYLGYFRGIIGMSMLKKRNSHKIGGVGKTVEVFIMLVHHLAII